MLDSYQDLLDELLSTPSFLRTTVSAHGNDVSPEVRSMIAVLAERDERVLDRLTKIRRGLNPLIKELPSLDDATAATNDGSIDDILAAFDTNRGELVSLLMNLSLKDWELTATHEIEGEVTIADEVEIHVEFDEEARARIVSNIA